MGQGCAETPQLHPKSCLSPYSSIWLPPLPPAPHRPSLFRWVVQPSSLQLAGYLLRSHRKKPPHFPQTSLLQRQRKEEIQRDRGGMKRCLRGWHNMTRPHAATRSPFVSEAFAPHPLPSLSQIQRLAAKTIISLQQPSRSSCAYSPLSPGEGLRHREIKWPPTSPWLQPSPVTGAQNGSPGRGFLSAFLPPPKTSES